ncbi:MAG: CinA family protein [Gammaproteobacteria bacterium]|nr:CinA family protein [Gammaproteobacteria bacterium]
MINNLYVLAKQLGALCIARNIKIALAESCTGGSVSALLTEVPGSSQWFNGGAVVYSNLAKTALLGVDSDLIKQYGAVSEPVAKAMAEGALKKLSADMAVSISGIAGPGGGTEEKPVGTVCFGLAKAAGCETKTMYFLSGRENVRQCAVHYVITWLIQAISV